MGRRVDAVGEPAHHDGAALSQAPGDVARERAARRRGATAAHDCDDRALRDVRERLVNPAGEEEAEGRVVQIGEAPGVVLVLGRAVDDPRVGQPPHLSGRIEGPPGPVGPLQIGAPEAQRPSQRLAAAAPEGPRTARRPRRTLQVAPEHVREPCEPQRPVGGLPAHAAAPATTGCSR